MKLHLVSFDVPWPADYGGVIDVYNRLEALSEAGVELILHAFLYGRKASPVLEGICKEVHYYKRKNRFTSFFDKDPMIVKSRAVEKLLNHLAKDDSPILFEGQHTTAFLNHPLLSGRLKFVRIHNIEHLYYDALAGASFRSVKRNYYRSESKKLKTHEEILGAADQLFCITSKDTAYYQQRFNNASYLPVAMKCTNQQHSQKDYVLYHGNLSVPENQKAAIWLIENVFQEIDAPVIIAGKSPNSKLRRKVQQLSNVELIESPDDESMRKIIAEAKIHVLYTAQETGIKLKLLNVLCSNAPIVCNDKMISGTGFEDACHIANSNEQMITIIQELVDQKVVSNKEGRLKILQDHSYSSHAQRVIGFLQ